ncbi:MAG TPA: histidine kinase dimerization/phospho-acceptor domain-containing protein, partial [Candidatus Saccharimonadales bacterium]|nr:histidine kinase dimerization/phospho-acceptor domain-containing protein [Candidatus Saccharimonadales bacterium]
MLFFLAHFGPGLSHARSWLRIPDLAFWFACVGTLFSLGGIILQKQQKYHYPLALVNYILVTLTSVSLIGLTGNIDSPFIALWLLISVFAGMFGGWVLVAYIMLANIFVVWHIFFAGAPAALEAIIKVLLIVETPLIASFVIWHAEGKSPAANQKAYNALAEQLSQVASKSEIVINSIADGVVSIDTKGTIQLINPAAQAMLGWQKQDAIGLDYRSIMKLIDNKGVAVGDELSPIRQVLIANKPITDNNLGLSTKSGKTIQLSLLVSPVTTGDQQAASGAIIVFRDITKEKEQERQRGEFISTASHEMRTPVAAIEGYLALAMNPQTAVIDDKARTYLQKAYESTQHLGRLFQDLLTVSKAEDGRLMPKPTVVDV